MILDDHIFHFEHIAIGNSLDALRFVYNTGSKLLMNKEVICPVVENKRAIQKLLTQHLVMNQQIISPYSIKAIMITPEASLLTVSTDTWQTINIKYEKLTVIDLENVEGIDSKEYIHEYVVYDRFRLYGANHKGCLGRIINDDDEQLVNKIWFVKPLKDTGIFLPDIICRSYIDSSVINKHEGSTILCRIKTEDMVNNSFNIDKVKAKHLTRTILTHKKTIQVEHEADNIIIYE